MRKAIAISAMMATSAVVHIGAAQAWTLKTLYSFKCCEVPIGHLVHDSATGDLYGTTIGDSAGTIFKVSKDGTETVLYSFSGGSDGGSPQSGPIKDDAGNLFGTTSGGGAQNGGVLYRLAPDGTYTVLHSFSENSYPAAQPHLDRDTGDLYGTTLGGGSSYGVVYRLAPNGTYRVLHKFTGGSDGSGPDGGIVIDSSGNLYGTTQSGGPANYGTVFRITPQGSESVLYAFTSRHKSYPDGDLALDGAGNLYGTVSGPDRARWGALFRLSRNGTLEFLHHFTPADPAGTRPGGHLVITKSGILYGSTAYGGSRGAGAVYEYSSEGGFKVLTALDNQAGEDGLIKDERGNLYGTTTYAPTLFEVVK